MTIEWRAAIGLAALLLGAGCTAPEPEGAPGGPASSSGGPTQPSGRPVPNLAGRAELRIVTQVGEQCPQEPVTPDPRCVPKPRPDTGFEVRDTSGDVVTRGRSGADGRIAVQVLAGEYVVRGDPVADYRITPERRVRVSGGESAAVPLTYTNGIQ